MRLVDQVADDRYRHLVASRPRLEDQLSGGLEVVLVDHRRAVDGHEINGDLGVDGARQANGKHRVSGDWHRRLAATVVPAIAVASAVTVAAAITAAAAVTVAAAIAVAAAVTTGPDDTLIEFDVIDGERRGRQRAQR